MNEREIFEELRELSEELRGRRGVRAPRRREKPQGGEEEKREGETVLGKNSALRAFTQNDVVKG